MKRTVNLAFCLGAGLALATTAHAQQSQQLNGQQMMRQQPYGQQQFSGQMQGQQQLTEQNIHSFFQNVQNTLQQTARTQDPHALRQFLSQDLAPDAEFTSISQLYLRDRHIATTIAEATDEMVTDALGYAATALQGRKLVSDYNISINVGDIEISPSRDMAKVDTVIQERGILTGPVGQRVAQARERIGQLRQQQQQGQWDQRQHRFGQLGKGSQQQRWGRMQDSQSQSGQLQSGQSQSSMGMGGAPGSGGGAEPQGVPFQTRANCTHEVMLQQGQIKLGNTFCRSTTRLGQ